MKWIALLLMIISVDALACWRLTGSIHVDTQRFDVNQKVDHDKTYSFPKGDYLVHLSVDKTEQIRVHVEQKQGLILATIAKIETQLKKNEEITSSKLNRDSGLTTEVRFKLQDI